LIGTLPLSSDSAKVLDLGCGKGAVSVQIASKFGFDVVGIDAMSEFLSENTRIGNPKSIDRR
jgi:cyclopropane fatty-acyl-phospholipid synthase-like methyltransferase